MTKYTPETLPEYFKFTIGDGDIIFNAIFPRLNLEFGINNRVFIGWSKDNEPRAVSYLIQHVIELLECEYWKICND
jgi:hypothetical protein